MRATKDAATVGHARQTRIELRRPRCNAGVQLLPGATDMPAARHAAHVARVTAKGLVMRDHPAWPIRAEPLRSLLADNHILADMRLGDLAALGIATQHIDVDLAGTLTQLLADLLTQPARRILTHVPHHQRRSPQRSKRRCRCSRRPRT